MADSTKSAIAAEMGDVLFSAVNLARHLGVDAEQVLRGATGRFEQRFQHMERAALEEGSSLDAEGPEQLELRWQSAKQDLSTL
jgi:ATP diphosphatase